MCPQQEDNGHYSSSPWCDWTGDGTRNLPVRGRTPYCMASKLKRWQPLVNIYLKDDFVHSAKLQLTAAKPSQVI